MKFFQNPEQKFSIILDNILLEHWIKFFQNSGQGSSRTHKMLLVSWTRFFRYFGQHSSSILEIIFSASCKLFFHNSGKDFLWIQKILFQNPRSRKHISRTHYLTRFKVRRKSWTTIFLNRTKDLSRVMDNFLPEPWTSFFQNPG